MDPSVVPLHLRPASPSRRRWSLLVLALLLVLVGASAVGAARASAYEITDFKAGTLTSDVDGSDKDPSKFFTPAAERPTFGIVDFTFATDGNGEPTGNTSNIRVDIPAGLTPNPRALPTCSDAQLDAQQCPTSTQVGYQWLEIRGTVTLLGRRSIKVQVPLYNMERGPGEVADFAFNPNQAPSSALLQGDKSPIHIVGGVRSDDQGLYFTITGLPKGLSAGRNDPALVRSKLVFWGVPGAASHDGDRGRARTIIPGVPLIGDQSTGGNQPSSDRTTAFLSMPTSCAGQQTTRVQTRSYEGGAASSSYTTPVGVTDCDKVPFDPGFGLAPQQVTRDSPAGLAVSLKVPQSQTAERATGHVKDVSLTLPPGTTISPSAANGLQTCSDAAFKQGTNDAIECPAASRVGTTSIVTPLLDQPLTGNVYLGDPQPGNRYRLLFNADGPGFSIRLTGSIKPDPATGQLTTVVDNAPQLPFEDLTLQFDSGPRAVIATPPTCGTATGSATLTPWSGNAAATPTASFEVAGCDGFDFAPGFSAAASPIAGAFAPLTVGFLRNDGDQLLSKIAVDLPPGLLAKIKGVPRCSEQQLAALACDPGSRVGTASVQAGPGPDPYGLDGPVYLTNAYGGGNFGFATVIHAVAGPYDLGYVVVRQAIKIDPNDAHVTVTSDPLPQIQEGIPLRLRGLQLAISRAGFTRNPTSCGTKTLTAGLWSANDVAVQRTAQLGFRDCAKQKFSPKIKVSFTGKKEMKPNRNPGVVAKVTQKDGEAGIKFTAVALPKAVALASGNANQLCDTQAALQDKCPPNTIVGSASATTSILANPLKGPVYFVKGQRTTASGKVVSTLPTLFVKLQGEATIYLRAVTAVSKGRLVTTFPTIPDAPLSSFTLNIKGGKKGIINSVQDICSRRQRASSRFASYSGAQPKAFKTTISTACGKAAGLKVRSVRRSGSTVTVKGTVAKKAKGRVTARVVCGKTTVRGTATPKKGRWTAKVRLTKGCASAKSATLRVGVQAKGSYAAGNAKARKLKLRS